MKRARLGISGESARFAHVICTEGSKHRVATKLETNSKVIFSRTTKVFCLILTYDLYTINFKYPSSEPGANLGFAIA